MYSFQENALSKFSTDILISCRVGLRVQRLRTLRESGLGGGGGGGNKVAWTESLQCISKRFRLIPCNPVLANVCCKRALGRCEVWTSLFRRKLLKCNALTSECHVKLIHLFVQIVEYDTVCALVLRGRMTDAQNFPVIYQWAILHKIYNA